MKFFNKYCADTDENGVDIFLTFDENVNENNDEQPEEKMNENHSRKFSTRTRFVFFLLIHRKLISNWKEKKKKNTKQIFLFDKIILMRIHP